jgi:hypothetical protein
MRMLKHLILVTLCLGTFACGEELELDDVARKESGPTAEPEELITLEQGLSMNLNVNWHDHDTLQVNFRFPARQKGQERYKICVRPGGSSGLHWSSCYDVHPDSTNTSTSYCNWAGECQITYFIPAEGCEAIQEVRVQEGLPPFFRETRVDHVGSCEAGGGTFVEAGGGHTAGCEVGPEAPAGTYGFIWDAHFWHTLDSSGGCPLPGTTSNGLACQVMPIPRGKGFVRWPGSFHYQPYNCPAP